MEISINGGKIMNDLFPMVRTLAFPEDKFFKDFFRGYKEVNNLSVDIKDEGDHFKVEADMPGLSKEDIKVDYKDNVLTIKAEKSEERNEGKEGDKYIVRERKSSSFLRQFIIDDVKAEEISAAFDKGVLVINLPKKSKSALPEGHSIEIK